MNKHLLVTLILIMLQLASSLAVGVFNSEGEAEAWRNRAHAHIDKIRQLPKEEAIPQLFEYVYKLNRQMKDPATEPILSEAREALIAIPGHAKFFENKIENLREKVREKTGTFEDYSHEQQLIGMLGYVQSAETIAVLGHFISDPEGRDGKTIGGWNVDAGDASYPVNCLIASNSLNRIGIENPPVTHQNTTGFEQVDAWKDWWNEVKAGKRTYRFKGSPIEYGPDGPVSAADLQRREHERVRVENGRARTGQGSEQTLATVEKSAQEKLSRWPFILGGALVLLALGGYIIQRSKSNRC